MGVRNGIDIYHGNGNVDAKLVKTGLVGPGWVSIKATQGKGFADPAFQTNRKNFADAGFRWRLAYDWIDTFSPAKDQADFLLRVIGPLAVGEGVMLDFEDTKSDPNTVLDVAHEWCDRVEQSIQRHVSVYSGLWYLSGKAWHDHVLFSTGRPRILAAYTSEARAKQLSPEGMDAWQFSGSATDVPGVHGACDLDQINNPAIFDSACGYTAIPVPPPVGTPIPKLVLALPDVRPLSPPQHTPNVAVLQVFLSALGFYPYKVDGSAGPMTIKGIESLQAAVGVSVDGWYGSKTYAACKTKYKL